MDESLIEKQNGNFANTVLPAGADLMAIVNGLEVLQLMKTL